MNERIINDVLKEFVFLNSFSDDERLTIENALRDTLSSLGYDFVINTQIINGRLEGQVFLKDPDPLAFKEINFHISPVDGET